MSDLPEDWQEQVLRAAIVFGRTGVTAAFPRLDKGFLSEKAKKQKRALGGVGGGRFVEEPDMKATLPGEGGGIKAQFIEKAKRAAGGGPPGGPPGGGGGGGPTKFPPGTAYPNAKRIRDGRMILTPKQMKDFEDGATHSMLRHIEQAEDDDGNPVSVLSREREALHDELVGKTFDGLKKPKGRKPWMIFLGGGSGAGKSTATDQIEGYPRVRKLEDYDTHPTGEAALIDADAFKTALPEFDNTDPMDAARFTHEESSMLAKAAAEVALSKKIDTVVDGTGDATAEKMGGKVEAAHKAGFDTEGIYVTVPTDEALVRAVARGIGSGRNVPLNMVMSIHRDVAKVTDQILTNFGKFSLYDTDIPLGDDPIPIIRDGQMLDPIKYREFLNKEHEQNLDQLLKARDRATDPTRHFKDTTYLRGAKVREMTIQRLDAAIYAEREELRRIAEEGK